MLKENEWYIKSANPDNFIKPNCVVCGHEVDCMVETPCETTIHTKCFNEVKNGMNGK